MSPPGEPTTVAGVTLERIVRNAMPAADGVRDFIVRIEQEAREEGARLARGPLPTVEAVALAMIRVRGAHNPTADELEDDEEVRPCAWCRLAAEQAIEAVGRLRGAAGAGDSGGRSGLAEERAALAAGTHQPAVDDFGNQYLARSTATPDPLPSAPRTACAADESSCFDPDCPKHGFLPSAPVEEA